MQQVEINDVEQMIRKLDAEWGAAATAYDLSGVVAFYAPHGTLVWPGQEPVHGSADIKTAWQGMFSTYKGLKLRFTPTRIDISKARDYAIDFGVVDFTADDEQGKPVTQIAKYLVVWQHIDGAWKVRYDSWNQNSG